MFVSVCERIVLSYLFECNEVIWFSEFNSEDFLLLYFFENCGYIKFYNLLMWDSF